MKNFFGALFVVALFISVANPFDLGAPLRVAIPIGVLIVQALFVGKGLDCVEEFRTTLKPVHPDHLELKGDVCVKTFADDSTTLKASFDGIPKTVAFPDGATSLGKGLEFRINGELVEARWARRRSFGEAETYCLSVEKNEKASSRKAIKNQAEAELLFQGEVLLQGQLERE